MLPARSMDESRPAQHSDHKKQEPYGHGRTLCLFGRASILYGGWNGIMRKDQKLQLARMRVEIGNEQTTFSI